MNKLPSSKLEKIPVVMLCGGRLISLAGQNPSLLKGLVKVGNSTLIEKIITQYSKFGAKKILLSAGTQISELQKIADDISSKLNISVEVIDTGMKTKTGNRITALKEHLRNSDCFAVTYSDTYSDIDLSKVYASHLHSGKIATLVAARVPTRFRVLGIRHGESLVRGFAQKPVIQNDWINGGFYFFNTEIFTKDLLDSSVESLVLEETVLEKLAQTEMLNSYPCESIWQHLDSDRDLEVLIKHLQ